MESSTTIAIIVSVSTVFLLLLLCWIFFSKIYNFFYAGSRTVACPLDAKNRTWILPPGAATVRVSNRVSEAEDTSCCCSLASFARCTSQYLYDCVTCYDFPDAGAASPTWLEKIDNGLQLNIAPSYNNSSSPVIYRSSTTTPFATTAATSTSFLRSFLSPSQQNKYRYGGGAQDVPGMMRNVSFTSPSVMAGTPLLYSNNNNIMNSPSSSRHRRESVLLPEANPAFTYCYVRVYDKKGFILTQFHVFYSECAKGWRFDEPRETGNIHIIDGINNNNYEENENQTEMVEMTSRNNDNTNKSPNSPRRVNFAGDAPTAAVAALSANASNYNNHHHHTNLFNKNIHASALPHVAIDMCLKDDDEYDPDNKNKIVGNYFSGFDDYHIEERKAVQRRSRTNTLTNNNNNNNSTNPLRDTNDDHERDDEMEQLREQAEEMKQNQQKTEDEQEATKLQTMLEEYLLGLATASSSTTNENNKNDESKDSGAPSSSPSKTVAASRTTIATHNKTHHVFPSVPIHQPLIKSCESSEKLHNFVDLSDFDQVIVEMESSNNNNANANANDDDDDDATNKILMSAPEANNNNNNNYLSSQEISQQRQQQQLPLDLFDETKNSTPSRSQIATPQRFRSRATSYIMSNNNNNIDDRAIITTSTLLPPGMFQNNHNNTYNNNNNFHHFKHNNKLNSSNHSNMQSNNGNDDDDDDDDDQYQDSRPLMMNATFPDRPSPTTITLVEEFAWLLPETPESEASSEQKMLERRRGLEDADKLQAYHGASGEKDTSIGAEARARRKARDEPAISEEITTTSDGIPITRFHRVMGNQLEILLNVAPAIAYHQQQAQRKSPQSSPSSNFGK